MATKVYTDNHLYQNLIFRGYLLQFGNHAFDYTSSSMRYDYVPDGGQRAWIQHVKNFDGHINESKIENCKKTALQKFSSTGLTGQQIFTIAAKKLVFTDRFIGYIFAAQDLGEMKMALELLLALGITHDKLVALLKSMDYNPGQADITKINSYIPKLIIELMRYPKNAVEIINSIIQFVDGTNENMKVTAAALKKDQLADVKRWEKICKEYAMKGIPAKTKDILIKDCLRYLYLLLIALGGQTDNMDSDVVERIGAAYEYYRDKTK